MKGLIVSTGYYPYSVNFVHALLRQGINVDFYHDNSASSSHYNNAIDTPLNQITLSESYTRANNKEYGWMFGLDHGALPIIIGAKCEIGVKVGCQILDFPEHNVTLNNSLFNKSILARWKVYSKFITGLDFCVFNQEISRDILCFNEKIKSVVSTVIRFPIKPMYIKDYDRKDFVLYIGRDSLDKGITNIMMALSLADNPPKLVTVNNGANYKNIKSLSEYLKIDYDNFDNCSEQKKWELLHECRFTVLGSVARTIPPLVPLEGISVGRTGICFDFDEYKKSYLNYVIYVRYFDINEFARGIEYLMADRDRADAIASGGTEYCKKNRTYDCWAKELIEFLKSSNIL